jgi:WD40 repeat protein
VSGLGFRLERQARLDLKDYPVDACWSADERALAVACGQGAVLCFDVPAGTSRSLGEHPGGALAVGWRPGSAQFASSGQDGEVRLWDARTGAAKPIHSATQWSEQLAFSGNGKHLAVATGRELRIFDVEGRLQAQPPAQQGVIAALSWRPKASEVAALGNGGARVHRLGPELVSREYAWAGACLTASWSPDGRLLASGMQDGSVHYWNIAAGSQSQMRGYGSKVNLTSWSANSRYLATSADSQIIVWEFAGAGPEGSEPLQLSSHTARVTQLAFQPRGLLLAAGARDHRLTLWRVTQPQQPIDADLLSDEVAVLRWSGSGERLAAIDSAGVLSLYVLRHAKT